MSATGQHPTQIGRPVQDEQTTGNSKACTHPRWAQKLDSHQQDKQNQGDFPSHASLDASQFPLWGVCFSWVVMKSKAPQATAGFARRHRRIRSWLTSMMDATAKRFRYSRLCFSQRHASPVLCGAASGFEAIAMWPEITNLLTKQPRDVLRDLKCRHPVMDNVSHDAGGHPQLPGNARLS